MKANQIHYVPLLMIAYLVCMVSCAVYYVLPESHHRATSNHSNTLQHYIINSESYFTSNTQFIFLPGKHRLYKSLLVRNVCNLTLQGVSPQTMRSTSIYCKTKNYLGILNSDQVELKFISTKGCGYSSESGLGIALNIFNSSNIVVMNCLIICQSRQCGLVARDTFNSVQLFKITSNYLMIAYNWANKSNVTVQDYHHKSRPMFKHSAITIYLDQNLNDNHHVTIQLSNIFLKGHKAIKVTCWLSRGIRSITFKKIRLVGVMLKEDAIIVAISTGNRNVYYGSNQFVTFISFNDCIFKNISSKAQRNVPALFHVVEGHLFQSYLYLHFFISNCEFVSMRSVMVLEAKLSANLISPTSTIVLHITNSSFSAIVDAIFVIWIGGAHMFLEGPVTFTKIETRISMITIVKGACYKLGWRDYQVFLKSSLFLHCN